MRSATRPVKETMSCMRLDSDEPSSVSDSPSARPSP